MKQINPWKTLSIIIGLPIVYMIFAASPIGGKLFIEKDFDYYIPFWGGIVLIHWISVFLVIKQLHSVNLNVQSIGYRLTQRGTYWFVGLYALLALVVFGYTEFMLADLQLDPDALKNIRGLTPKNTTQRLFFILLVFSTGFCEEFVWRGFAITQLKALGVNKWLAIVIASFLFVGIHGINGYLYRFPFLFIGGIVFGIIFVLSKRLLPSMIVHLLINLSVMMSILSLANH